MPDFLHKLCLEFRPNSSILVSSDQRILFRLSVIFFERLPSGHSAIKPEWCCSDGCPSGGLSHLYTGSVELSQSHHWVLDHLSYQGLSPPAAQFGREASSRKRPGCSKLLPFKNY